MAESEDHETAVIPRDATVAELQEGDNTEEKSANESEPRATELRDLAKLYREWITQLRIWTAEVLSG